MFKTDKNAVMKRLQEHLDAVKGAHPEWVGIFLQGSQNYKLDYEGSDIDSKLIVLPSFDDFVLNRKMVSYTHIMENEEHVDVKDVRSMFDCFRKQNVNFVEILFTEYYILNPKYEALFSPVLEARELVGRYNNYATVNSLTGMALEKQKALCHPYPATQHKIDLYGFDSKQYHHIKRMEEFMNRWLAGVPYADCLLSENVNRLLEIKLNIGCDLDTAVKDSDRIVKSMKQTKDQYMKDHPPTVNHDLDGLLNRVVIDLFKHNFRGELEKENEVIPA